MKAVVLVRLKEDVPDFPGRTLAERLSQLGFPEVKKARVGRLIELVLEGGDRDNGRNRVEQMCARLLTNQTIEEYEILSVE